MSEPSIKNKVKSALNFLNVGYHNGSLTYPRVDNSYIREPKNYSLFPHPELNPISVNLKPFAKKTRVQVNKEEVILFLSSLRIISPSQIEDVFNYIDYYLDDDLFPRNDELKKESELLLSIIDSYVLETGLTDRKILALKNEFFKAATENAENGSLFAQNSVKFFSLGEKNKAKCAYIIKEFNRKADRNSLHGGVDQVPSIRDGLVAFREKEILEQSSSIKIK